MALGRPAPMLTSASPGRAAALVPAPVERSQLPGHRQRSPNSAALTVVACVNRDRCPRARARGGRRFQRAMRQTGLHRPAGRRQRLLADVDIIFFAELLLADSAADDGARATGADADVGFAGSGGGDGAGAGRAQPATGSSTTIAKFRSTDSGCVR